jgi:hypothetical protein
MVFRSENQASDFGEHGPAVSRRLRSREWATYDVDASLEEEAQGPAPNRGMHQGTMNDDTEMNTEYVIELPFEKRM